MAEELQGLISVEEAIAAVRDGFHDQGKKPAYSAPRLRIQHEDRRVSVHSGGYHRLPACSSMWNASPFTAAPSNTPVPANAFTSPTIARLQIS